MSATSLWQEARHTDGRVYYWNTQTKETRWTKPDPAPQEQSSTSQPWKEYTTPEGRKYYHNAETKATVWEMPEAYKNALAPSNNSTPKPSTPSQNFVAGGGSSSFQQYPQHRDQPERDRFGDRSRDHTQSDVLRSNFVSAAANHIPTTNEPEYGTFEEAEAAFMKLLKRFNVQPDATWEETMKTIIQDPQYRAIKDPKDRKAAFEKYVIEARAQDKERAKERMAKLRQDFTTMLKSHPEIKHNTRWKTARPIIEGETKFRSTGDDAERRQLFEEYVADLRKQHIENEANTRKAALDELGSLLKVLELEPYTRWSDAQRTIDANERFQSDDKFRTLTKLDVLTAFQSHVKSLERSLNDTRQIQKKHKGRTERKNRDAFQTLLRELRNDEKIKAGTKWMEVLPLIEEDPRYVAMLGQPGSTPLDLFWDVVEEQERLLRGKRNEVLDVLDDKRYEITPKTSLEEFMEVMQSDRRTSSMKSDDLKLIFTRLHEKILRRNEEDKHHAERAQRRAVDALRSRIKHLEPSVRPTDSWDDVRPRIERFEEYRALENEEIRRSAFDKVIKRMKEKEADAEQLERVRRNERAERDRDRVNGHRRTKGKASSHTPEPDAYEADRRKAMADRERQYRKSSNTGLSPPPTDAPHGRSRRDARDRYDERHDRTSRGHERDRRDREAERDRAYMNRADPRDVTAKELDYGDSAASLTGSTGRRRRDSEDEDGNGRDSKRLRRDQQSKTPVDQSAAAKEEEDLKSGSEEGELAED